MELTWFLFLIPRKLVLLTSKQKPYENIGSGSGYSATRRPVIQRKAGPGVMGILLQILSSGNRVNQITTGIVENVRNFSKLTNGGLVTIALTYLLRFAKGKKVLNLCKLFSHDIYRSLYKKIS